MKSVCGIDCRKCGLKETCKGCAETGGQPFGGKCVIAECVYKNKCKNRGVCQKNFCQLKADLLEEFNALKIKDMPKITDLNALKGSFINLEYPLPSGETVKFWDDSRIYLGNQTEKENSERCYGIVADEEHLLVCEYGENGSDAEIVIYKKRGK